jgi:hypothetical protein
VVERFHARPYTYIAQGAVDAALLPGVPGTAPARIGVEVAPDRPGATYTPWGALAWRRRRPGGAGVENMVWNGDVSEDLDGWTSSQLPSGLLAGGTTMIRLLDNATTDIPYAVRASVGTAARQGVGFVVRRRFRKGRLYTLEFLMRNDVGNQAWEAAVGLIGPGNFASVAVPATASYADGVRRLTIRASGDSERAEVVFRTPVARAAADDRFVVAGVRLYEGTVPPAEPTQTGGRGAPAPFGVVQAETYDVSAATGPWTVVEDAAATNGTRLNLDTGATGTSNNNTLEWLLDPNLLEPPDFAGGELDVEVYVIGSVLANSATLKAYTRNEQSIDNVYTREHGLAGRSLPVEYTSSAGRMYRAGTVTFARGPGSTGRHRLGVTFDVTTLAPNAGAILRIDAVLLLPVWARMASPSGKDPYDGSYPLFIPWQASTDVVKITGPDGAGSIRVRPTGSAAVASGGDRQFGSTSLGGEPLEVQPGDVELLAAWVRGLAPDMPVPQGNASAYYDPGLVHAAVTPRYRLLNPAT